MSGEEEEEEEEEEEDDVSEPMAYCLISKFCMSYNGIEIYKK